MPYRRIVVGTDGSSRAHAAVGEAADLARATGATLVVVTAFAAPVNLRVLDGPVPPEGRIGITDRQVAERCANDAASAARAQGVEDVRVVAVEGAPADALLDVATSEAADLVVVGSVGMTDASRFVLGSVANTISHHATCDVLVVHTEGDR